ncbi:hypothetical protein P2H44_22985 [Albimonas sp. CAU 1670]|uniref:hypothetical protein n=1 Tax=Albimonas sp. CAU 1670 TaxID=3032599 RepID=UPI0023D9D015|nr:hypothetical protein [Albimonas sp. CAU 1670]MDF2235431.1 hypothetical protein [Albimonas sp. CAU 1670]
MIAFELLDRRLLAALRFVDAVGAPVTSPVEARAEGVDPRALGWARKRDGTLLLLRAPGLEGHAAAFDVVPGAPAPGEEILTLDLRPVDPALAPRRARIALPRDPDPEAAGSLMAAAEIRLAPGQTAAAQGLEASVQVRVRHADGRAVEGAVVRARAGGPHPEALGITGPAGEALVRLPGLPIASPGPGATVLADLEIELDAVIDVSAVRLHAAAEIAAARAAYAARRTGFPDPDAILAALLIADPGVETAATGTVDLRPGRPAAATLTWTPA